MKNHGKESGSKAGRKPDWLKKPLPTGPNPRRLQSFLADRALHTVCREARCPNRAECFDRGTATFLLLGDRCTRKCAFCAVKHGLPDPPDPEEPRRIAQAVRSLNLSYVVLTSVTRDDLPDGGADHYCRTIQGLLASMPEIRVEALIPDFQGRSESLRRVALSGLAVLNHNLETVPRLYPGIRPQADYRRSLDILERARGCSDSLITKSGLMLGLGEEPEEVWQAMGDLREAGCEVLTLGQYLQPCKGKVEVQRYLPPEEFSRFREAGLSLGFAEVLAGPFVRSSLRAEESFREAVRQRLPPRGAR